MSVSDHREDDSGSPESPGAADLLWGYVERMHRGEKLDEAAIRSEYPEEAEEILRQLSALRDIGGEDLGEETRELGSLGDYVLRREIGRGGMGVVYEAWQTSMSRQVALKVLPPGIAADSKTVARFIREAQVAGKLNHQNVVAVYGMGVEGGTPYYAMEYVEGKTLAEILASLKASEGEVGKRGGDEKARAERRASTLASIARLFTGETEARRLAASDGSRGQGAGDSGSGEGASGAPAPGDLTAEYCYKVARAFAEVAEGLQYAHTRGIIHRDLKPSNLILDRDGRLRILDFGLARMEGQQSLTASGDLLGTVLYMSPEQALARRIPIDRRTDIYSLGVTLYESLAWRPPFEGKSAQDTLSQIIFRDPAPPRRRNPRIPKDLETIVLKCVRKTPDERYGTAEALAQDLWRFVRGDPIEARPQGKLEIVGRKAWRNRGKVGAACLGLLLLVTAGLLGTKYLQEAHEERVREYEGLVIGAITKMELGKSVRAPQAPVQTAARATSSSRISAARRVRGEPGIAYAEMLEPELALLTAPGGDGRDPVREAAEDLEKAVGIFAGRPDGWFHLARAQESLGRDPEARESLRRALMCDRGFVPALLFEAESLDQAGERDRAAETRKRAEGVGETDWSVALLSAQKAEEERRWADAVKAYEKLIQMESKGGGLYLGSTLSARLGSGRARLELGDQEGAIEDFTAAHTLWPDLAEPVVFLGRAYFLHGNRERAAERFERLVANAERKDEAILKVSRTYQNLKEHEAALAWAERAAPSAERELARTGALWRLKRFEDAEKVARKGLELYPKDPKLTNQLGMALHDLGKLEEALVEYRKAIELDPKDAIPHTNLGVGLSDQGKLEEAIAEYRKAIELDPKDAIPHTNLGVGLNDQGKPDEAIAEYRKAIELDPKYPVPHYNLGNVLEDQGKLEEAIAEYRKSIELDPKYVKAHNNLAYTLERQGKHDEALATWRKTAELDPEDVIAQLNIAEALRILGHLEDAIALSRKTAEVNRSSAEPYMTIAEALRTQGKNAEALVELRKALEVNPKFGPAHYALGYALKDEGRLLEACSEFREALDLGRPSWDLGSLLELLRWRQKPHPGEEMEGLIKALEKLSQSTPPPDPSVYQALALALNWPGATKSPERALEHARLAVEKLGDRNPDALAFLAEVQTGAGEELDAVSSLEKAVTLPGANAHHAWLLEEARKQLLPLFASCESIDAALDPDFPRREILVPGGAEWRFFRGRTEPSAGLEWTEIGFDDSSWETGLSGFGNDYDRGRNRLMGTTLPDVREYTTLYTRHVFRVTDPGAYRRCRLLGYSDDGFVAYLNGTEIGRVRAGVPNTRIPSEGVPEGGSSWLDGTQPVEVWNQDGSLLRSGENVLAVQGLHHKLKPFYLEPILEAECAHDPARPRKLLEAFRAAIAGETAGEAAGRKDDAAPARLAYMEARILESEKKPTEAAARFEEAIRLDGSQPHPFFRAARILRAAGDLASAEAKLREALKRSPVSRMLWDEWYTLSVVDLKRGATRILQDLEEIAGGDIPAGSYAADLRWALRELSGRGVLRIRCGGEEFTDKSGNLWGRDRFATSARISPPKKESVEGTEDDVLFQGGRSFDSANPRPHGYRIPVPPGRYRVTGGFAEVSLKEPEKRVFDVLLEGKVVQADYEPKRLKAEDLSYEVMVEDGYLDIEFVSKTFNSKISAIAIETLR